MMWYSLVIKGRSLRSSKVLSTHTCPREHTRRLSHYMAGICRSCTTWTVVVSQARGWSRYDDFKAARCRPTAE